MQVNPHEAIDFIYKNSTAYAKAKAEVTYLEEFRKSKKANQAYAHPEYQALLKGLQAAVEAAEELRWQLIAAQARIDVWRSQEASNRTMDRVTQ